MNTTNSNAIQDIVSKMPVTLFFEQMPDRKQALKYMDEEVEACIMPNENFEGKPIPLYLNEPILLCIAETQT